MKDIIIPLAKLLGVFAIVAILAVAIGTIKKNEIERTYNNGICTTCGGHYNFVSAACSGCGSFKTHYYYYECDYCHKLIEIAK